MKLGKAHSQSSNLGKILKEKSKKMTACSRGLAISLLKQSEAFRPPEDYVGRFSCLWKSSDLVFQVADREFHVHRAVLILSFLFFESMLS